MAGTPLGTLLRRVRSLLESRYASFWVIGAWVAMTLVWLVPFQLAGQSRETIRAIAEDWLAFRVVYVLVAVTTLLCSWARLSRDLGRIRRADRIQPVPTESAERYDGEFSAVADWLDVHGYHVTSSEGALHAVKNRYSLLGGTLFHFGIVLFGVLLVVHLLTVKSTVLRVTEGQSIAEAAISADATSVPSAFGYLTLESIEPKYYKDVLLFTRLDAVMKKADGSTHTFALSRPYWAGTTALMCISDYNLAPRIEIVGPDGNAREYVVAMNLVPPGTEDTVQLPDVPLDISVIAYPDHGVVNGRDVSLSYNATDPAFLVALQRQGRTGALVARQLVGLNEPVSGDGYTVRITKLAHTGTFRITTAPALPFVALGLLTMLAGLAWRYLFRRQTVLAWSAEDAVLLDGWLDLGGREVGRHLVAERLRKAGLIQ